MVSLSIDTDGLLKSDEQKGQDAQKAAAAQGQASNAEMMQNLVKGATPQLAKAAADNFDPAMLQGMTNV
jgi:hypothetical protein